MGVNRPKNGKKSQPPEIYPKHLIIQFSDEPTGKTNIATSLTIPFEAIHCKDWLSFQERFMSTLVEESMAYIMQECFNALGGNAEERLKATWQPAPDDPDDEDWEDSPDKDVGIEEEIRDEADERIQKEKQAELIQSAEKMVKSFTAAAFAFIKEHQNDTR